METSREQQSTNRNEKKSMAVSGLILASIGLFGSFIDNWRTISLVLCVIAVIISAYNIRNSKRAGIRNRLSVPALIFALVGIIVAAYFLSRPVANNEEAENHEVPGELRDSASIRDQDESQNQLRNIIDTTQAH